MLGSLSSRSSIISIILLLLRFSESLYTHIQHRHCLHKFCFEVLAITSGVYLLYLPYNVLGNYILSIDNEAF